MDAVAKFETAVRAKLPKHRSATYAERQQAVAAVARTNPQLHVDYLLATNPQAVKQRLIREKYDHVL